MVHFYSVMDAALIGFGTQNKYVPNKALEATPGNFAVSSCVICGALQLCR